MFTLNEIVQAMTGKEYSGNLAGFPEAVIDSRKVSKDVLFAAVPGEHTDGHKFIPSAFADGAAAALIQEEVPGDYDLLDLRNNEISFRLQAMMEKDCVSVWRIPSKPCRKPLPFIDVSFRKWK